MAKKYNEFILKEDYAILKIKNNFLGELDCLIDIEDIEKVKISIGILDMINGILIVQYMLKHIKTTREYICIDY